MMNFFNDSFLSRTIPCYPCQIDFNDIMLAFVLFFIFSLLLFLFCKKFKLKPHYMFILWSYHAFFSVVFLTYTAVFQGDLEFFYGAGVVNTHPYQVFHSWKVVHNIAGTELMFLTSYMLHNIFYLDLLSVNLVYAFMGFLGIMFTYLTLTKLNTNNKFIVKLIIIIFICLPSLHFWTSSLGKDALVFLGLSLIGWTFVNQGKITKLGLFGFFILMISRPHIAFIFIIAFYLYKFFTFLMIDYKEKFILIFSLPIFFFVGFYGILPYVYSAANFDDYNLIRLFIEFTDFFKERVVYYLDGGSYFNYDSFLMHSFAYMFFPLFNFGDPYNMIVSIENIFLLLCFFFAITHINFNFSLTEKKLLILSTTFSILLLISLSYTTYNLGISNRQKWMFFPFTFFIIVKFFDSYVSTRNLKNY